MPRNGSGVYSKPAGTTAVTGTTIESAKYNSVVDDLVEDANAARPIVAGGTGAVTASAARTALAVPGTATTNTFTATQKWAKGADVASAATLTLGDDGNYFDITGTTPITSIATKGVGTVVKLHFDGAVTLTHSADLVLPNSANFTTSAGDEVEFTEYAAGDWRCTGYLIAPNGEKDFWVLADIAGNILASRGVASVTDDGVGLITVTFSVAFSSAQSYATVCTVYDGTASGQVRNVTFTGRNTTSIAAKCVNSSNAITDPVEWNFMGRGT